MLAAGVSLLLTLQGPASAQAPGGIQDPSSPPAEEPWVAILGATVHSMVPGEESVVADVLLRGDRIAAVGQDLSAPPGALRIQADGSHLVPGLIDGRVSYDPDHDLLYSAWGVTTICDLGSDPGLLFGLRQREVRDMAPGPSLLTAGALLDGYPPATPEATVLPDVPSVDRSLPVLFEAEPDLLSLYTGLAPEVWERVVELGQEAGIPVWGPKPRDKSLQEAIDAGMDVVLGIEALLPRGIDFRIVLPPALRSGMRSLANSETTLVPMVNLAASYARPPELDEGALELLSPIYHSWWGGENELRVMRYGEDETLLPTWERILLKERGALLEMQDLGVRLMPGSSAPNVGMLPGRALHTELREWEAAGIAPVDVLRAVTAGAAEILDLDDRGQIEVGRLADLVLVEADPREGVEALSLPQVVVVRGRVLDRNVIDDALDTVRVLQSAAMEESRRPVTVPAPPMPEEGGRVLLAGQVERRMRDTRVSAERFHVVEKPDGRIWIAGRLDRPASYVWEESQMAIVQELEGDRLVGFTISVVTSVNRLICVGIWQPEFNRYLISRQVDDTVIENERLIDRIQAVSGLNSITTHLVLGQRVYERSEEGSTLPVLRIQELFEPEVVAWRIVHDDSGLHSITDGVSQTGLAFNEVGAPTLWVQAFSNENIEAELVEIDHFGGSGFPLPEEKTVRMAERLAHEEDVGAQEAAGTLEAGAPEGAGGSRPRDDGAGTSGEPGDG